MHTEIVLMLFSIWAIFGPVLGWLFGVERGKQIGRDRCRRFHDSKFRR